MKTPSIYQIKELTLDSSPYFFTPKTLRFFNQTMRGFSVKKQPDGRVKISQPMRDNAGRIMGETVRFFNPVTNSLDRE